MKMTAIVLINVLHNFLQLTCMTLRLRGWRQKYHNEYVTIVWESWLSCKIRVVAHYQVYNGYNDRWKCLSLDVSTALQL